MWTRGGWLYPPLTLFPTLALIRNFLLLRYSAILGGFCAIELLCCHSVIPRLGNSKEVNLGRVEIESLEGWRLMARRNVG